MRSRVLMVTLSSVVMGGCFALTDFEDLQTTRRETFELPFMEQGDVPQFDILFVVDRPTHQDQVPMWNAMDGLMMGSGEVPVALGLAQYDLNGGPGAALVELHIGVITSDLGAGATTFGGCDIQGDDGVLRDDVLNSAEYPEYGCEPLDAGDRFLRVENGVVQNMGSVTDVSAAVQCMILAQMSRTTTCPIKQPLRAVQRALGEHRFASNDEFLQSEGGLAVVFVSGEDDCSAEDYSLYDQALFSPYHCFSQGLDCVHSGDSFTHCAEVPQSELMPTEDLADLLEDAKGGSSVVISVMAGPYEPDVGVRVSEVPDVGMAILPSCSAAGSGIEALPAVRLSLLKDRFADTAVFQEICTPDSGGFFDGISHKLSAQLAYRCMPKVPVDTEPEVPGMQALCDIFDVVNPGEVTGSYSVGPHPRCADSGYGTTCWEMMPEAKCTAGYKLVVQRAPEDDMELRNYIVEADCLVHLEE